LNINDLAKELTAIYEQLVWNEVVIAMIGSYDQKQSARTGNT
jgi:hypothetical protein